MCFSELFISAAAGLSKIQLFSHHGFENVKRESDLNSVTALNALFVEFEGKVKLVREFYQLLTWNNTLLILVDVIAIITSHLENLFVCFLIVIPQFASSITIYP